MATRKRGLAAKTHGSAALWEAFSCADEARTVGGSPAVRLLVQKSCVLRWLRVKSGRNVQNWCRINHRPTGMYIATVSACRM